MNIVKKALVCISLAGLVTIQSCELFDDSDNPFFPDELTEAEIIEGLKEALTVGLGNSVTSASSVNGYLQNEAIKILLPEEVQSLQSQINSSSVLSTAYSVYIDIENNGNDLFDDLVTAMNRGAEDAAGTALPIFGDAIEDMSIADARNILDSNNGQAATDFFERETRDDLVTAFSPNVKQALDDNQASQLYASIVSLLDYEINPLVGSFGELLNTDPNLPATLDEYATGKAVDGLFHLVGEEEEKIRADPFAWGNSIIERVFGSR